MSEARQGSAPWYQGGLRFTCTSCGDCCRGPMEGHVFMELEDVEAMAAHLELSLEAFGRKYLRRVEGERLALIEHANRDCIFWDDAVGCRVYAARPLQCRQFPFWPELLASQEAWNEEAESCPGMNDGRTYTRAEAERIAAGKRGTRRGKRRLRTV